MHFDFFPHIIHINLECSIFVSWSLKKVLDLFDLKEG